MPLKTVLVSTLLAVSLAGAARADITNGLTLYLPLDETTGNIAHDATTNANNGSIIGFSADSQWANGWIQKGLNVNQNPVTSQYISVPDAANLNFGTTLAFTLAAWVKMPATQLSGAAVIAKGTGGGGEEYAMDVNANKFRVYTRNSSGTATALTSTVAPNNNWQHVVAVYDGAAKAERIYINGQLNAAVTNANLASLKLNTHELTVGSRQSSTSTYNLPSTNAFFDEVRVYNRALSSADVLELYSFGGRIPAITTQPRSITNYVGDYAPFTVGIDNNNSTLPVSYQWTFNGTNLPGATAATLVVTNVQLANSGAYSVAVSNVIGVSNSATVLLQVQPLPAADISSALAGYWKFDETSGATTAADSSGHGFDASVESFSDYNACWITGATNGALNFNADGSTLNVVTVPASGTPAPAALEFSSHPAFTLSAWIKATSPQTNGGAIICKGSGGGGEQYAMDLNSGTFRFYVRGANGASVNLTTTSAFNGTWQHVAAVFDAINGIMEYYVNGQLVNVTVPPPNLLTNAHEVSIGNRQSNGTSGYNLPFTGGIDDVRIYGRALTSADISALYLSGGAYPPTVNVQPVGGSVFVGDNFKLSAIVSGTFPLQLQWRKDGAPVPGGTSSTLLLTNVQVTDAGTYTLAATNSSGFAISSNAVLQVSPFYPTNALAGYWKMDDATGSTAVDSSTNANDASLINFPGDDTEWVAGRIGDCLSFSLPTYAGSYLYIADAPSLNFNSSLTFSLSAWVKGGSQANGAAIICKGYGGGGEQYDLDVQNNVFRFFVRTAGNTAAPGIVSAISPNGLWQHVVATFDGNAGVMALYVNGQLAGTAAAPNSLLANAGHEVSIGAREANASSGYTLNFVGLIDDARIYSRALSAADVLNLYDANPQAPFFLTQPSGYSRYVGDSVAFSATVDGTAPLSYQWQKDGTNIPGATTISLLLTNLQPADAGAYSLSVTNFGGATNSVSAVLTVSPFDVANAAAYWKFDETSGSTAADATGHGNTGTLVNMPTDDSEWVPGRSGHALNFNADHTGANVVTIPDAPGLNFDANPAFSIAVWVRGGTAQANGAGIVAKGAGSGGEQFAMDAHVDQLSTVAYRFYVRNAAGTAFNCTTLVAPNNRWQHVVAVFDGFLGTMTIYVNGQVASTTPGPTSLLASSHEVSIGNRQSSATSSYNLPFTGLIDDVRLYNRALTAGDIQQIYAQAGTLAPVIYTQPQDVTNYARETASFSVVADGTDPLSFQWQHNTADVAGATNATLNLPDLQLADAGSYRVRVTDANSSVTSSNAMLTVLATPAPDLTNELIAYWNFDETNGASAADSSGHGNNASLLDFPGDDSEWVPGIIGGALHFSVSGSTSYRVSTDNPVGLDNGNQFSFSFWAKRDPGVIPGNPRILSVVNGSSWAAWTPGRGVGLGTPAMSTEPSTTTWHHFVELVDRVAGTYSLYVDGVRQVANAGHYALTDPSSGQYWFIGHSENSLSDGDSWVGLLDEVRLYNRLLNYNDVQALFLAGQQPTLNATLNGSTLTLTWPRGASGFRLYSASSVTGGTWTAVATAPTPSADGVWLSVSVPTTGPLQFYRLQNP